MNRNIVITGASGGIGSAIARRFAKDGDRLLLVGHKNRDALFALARELQNRAVQALPVLADLATPEGCRAVVTAADNFFGTPDVLINNAGISHTELFQDSDEENMQEILSANLLSQVRLTKLFLPQMIRRKSGKVLCVSSVWGEIGASMEVEYSMTKGGINAFVKALAKEVAPSGISVNAISPGAIDTQMNACYTDEELEELAREIPMGRMGAPEEVADLTYLISIAPSYLTGQVIRIDGGWV